MRNDEIRHRNKKWYDTCDYITWTKYFIKGLDYVSKNFEVTVCNC